MIIRPQQKLKNLIFYNNLILIIIVFSVICLLTSMLLCVTGIKSVYVPNQENITVGPIKINNKPHVYKINAHWDGHLSSSYLSGEVLDEEKDTIYEFGKDFWHEEGYDSDGHWSEADRNLTAYLTFTEKGTYYIQFNTDERNMSNIRLKITLMRGSYVAHSMVGSLSLLLAMFLFCAFNRRWVWDKLVILNEHLEEMNDD